MELDQNDRIAAIAAGKRDREKEEQAQHLHEGDATTTRFIYSS
jgi:hypothetical protein